MKRLLLILVVPALVLCAGFVLLHFAGVSEPMSPRPAMRPATPHAPAPRDTGRSPIVSSPAPHVVVAPRVARREEAARQRGRATPRREFLPADAIDNEFVLSFYDERDKRAFVDLARREGAEIIGEIDFAHAVRVRVKTGVRLSDLLEHGPAPIDSSPNYYVRMPRPPEKSPLPPESDYAGFAGRALEWLGVEDSEDNWGNGIRVAVLDMGVGTHPSLDETRIERLSLVGDDASDPTNRLDHGTAVASLIAGHIPEARGLAPASSILSIKVLDGKGVGDSFTLAEGIIEAVERNAKIINISLGSRGDSFILRNAVEFALAKGAAIVAAAGNDALEGVSYPARYEGVLAVSAVDARGEHLFFSNSGPEIDIAAPGYGVHAAWEEDKIVSFNGTSAAVPFVVGALAALLSEYPYISPQAAADILRQHSDDVGAPGRDYMIGSGILNARRALNWNVRGIYDISVGRPYVQLDGDKSDDAQVVARAQNKGTEPLERVDFTVKLDGVSHVLKFYNVGVGETISHVFRLPRARFEGGGRVGIVHIATLDGVQDANPADNAITSVILGRD